MEKVKVSLILPSFNVAKYMDECLASVIRQTLQDIEILCVDAGSKDGTLEIIEEYAQRDTRIRLIRSPVKSYGYQMNIGLDTARGEYIGIVETDDIVPPEMYEELYSIAEMEHLDFVKADFFRFRMKDGRMEKTLGKLTGGKKEYQNRVIDISKERECFTFLLNTWAGIYRRAFLEEYHIRHNESPGAAYQDNGFWFQTFMYAKRAYFYEKPFYMVRRDNPDSSVNDPDKAVCICDEYRFIYQLLNAKKELLEKYKFDYTLRCFASYCWALKNATEAGRKIILRRFVEDFQEYAKNGMIDFQLFQKYHPGWEKDLRILLDHPKDILHCSFVHL